MLNVNLVINFDVPVNREVYTHRIGQSGHFGTPGIAVSLATTLAEVAQLQSYSSQLCEATHLRFEFTPNLLSEAEQNY